MQISVDIEGNWARTVFGGMNEKFKSSIEIIKQNYTLDLRKAKLRRASKDLAELGFIGLISVEQGIMRQATLNQRDESSGKVI